jgi:hypothetical protein
MKRFITQNNTKALKNVSYTRTLRVGNQVWIELESFYSLALNIYIFFLSLLPV